MTGRVQSIFKMVGAIIHSKNLLFIINKRNTIYFVRPSKLSFEAHCS